jgi:hypothetical protein
MEGQAAEITSIQDTKNARHQAEADAKGDSRKQVQSEVPAEWAQEGVDQQR